MDGGVELLAGVDQRVDGALLDLVGQVPRGHRGGVGAYLVVYFVVLDEHVEDVGEDVLVVFEGDGEGLGGGLAHGAVGVVEQRQGFGFVQALDLAVVLHVAGHPPGDLVEESREGAPGGVGLALQDGLLGLAELVGAVAAFLFEEVPVAGQVGVVHQGQRDGLVQRRPFELEEDQVVADGGGLLHDGAEQAAVGRVVALGGVQQVGVDDRGVHQLDDFL